MTRFFGIMQRYIAPISFLLFFWINCFFPKGYHGIRTMMILITFLFAITRKRAQWKQPYIPVAVLVFVNMISIAIGVLAGNPGALDRTTINGNILYPFLFTAVFLAFITDDDRRTCRIIMIAVTTVSVYYFFYFFSLLPDWLLFDEKELYIVMNQQEGYYHSSTDHETMIMFSFPMTVALILCRQTLISTFTLSAFLFLQLWIIFIISRDALTFLALLTIPMVLGIRWLFSVNGNSLRRNSKYLFGGLLFMAVLLVVVFFDVRAVNLIIDKMMLKVANEFFSGDAFNVTARGIQAKLLISRWLDSPWVGHGAGAFMPEYIRSSEVVWAYELSYHALLFQKGLLGFIVNIGFYAYIVFRLIRVARNDSKRYPLCVALVAGLFGYLISAIVDPRLWTFGYTWCVMIPYCYSWVIHGEEGTAIMKI